MHFLEQIKEDAGSEIGKFLGVAVGLATKAGEINSDAVVVVFDDGSGGLALQMMAALEDQAAGVPEIGAEGDVFAVRKSRTQAAGRFGSTTAQRPSANFPGSTIKSPSQPLGVFLAHVFQSL